MPLFNFDEDSLWSGIQSKEFKGLQLILQMVVGTPMTMADELDDEEPEKSAQLKRIQEIMSSGDPQGKSYALHVAALMADETLSKHNRDGWGNILLFMLKLGCEPNQQDKESGNTLAHYAALAGDNGVAKYLREQGCKSYNVSNHAGQSPYEIAQEKHSGDIFLHTALSTSASSQFFSYPRGGHHGYARVEEMEVREDSEDDDEERTSLSSGKQSRSSCFTKLVCCFRS